MIWNIVSSILLVFLALLILGLVLPLCFTVQYSSKGFYVWLRFLFLKIRLFPLKASKAGAKKEKSKKAKSKKAKSKKEKIIKKKIIKKKTKNKQKELELLKKLIHASFAAGNVFVKHMRINAVKLVIPVHCQDASETALLCGRIHTGLGALRAGASGRIKLRFKRLQIMPDFTGELQKEFYFAFNFVFNPVIMFKMAFIFLRLFLKKRSVQHGKQ